MSPWTGLTLLAALSLAAADDRPVRVEPRDLTRRPDLVGREVEVDDRVSRFQYHKETDRFDQIFLRRSPDVPFDLPAPLRYKQSPQAPAVVIRGVLRNDAGRWHVDVTGVTLEPSDVDRLNSALATVPRTDTKRRRELADWAERRARAFADLDGSSELSRKADEELLRRAREIESEAIRVEAERPGPDPAAHWLGLAARARSKGVPEPEPSALAHRGFRAALAAGQKAASLNALLKRIETFFPDAPKAPGGESTDLDRWLPAYNRDPSEGYRRAPVAARPALDHRLWADAFAKWVERQADEQPGAAFELADEAAAKLPDRPEVGRALFERGLVRAERDVASLRLGEVEAIAKASKERLDDPGRARALLRSWLDDRRDRRLGPRDAEGRLALARQYDDLLGDRAASVALLKEATALDPSSREVAGAFLRLGYRKVDGRWVEPGADRAPDAAEGDPEGPKGGGAGAEPEADRPVEGPDPRGDTLLGATPEQVLAKMGGAPTHKARSATQGRLIEQWVYSDPRRNQYINFLFRPGDSRPRVVAHFSLPRSGVSGPSQ